MRRQSVKAPIIRYTELEERGLVGMRHERNYLLLSLLKRGFICVEGKVIGTYFDLCWSWSKKELNIK
ncbi:hypothetical protein [Exiguobacterium undae]|uniref:Uncharacterized protein n=1 Tax=Exiguobacterium undae TaxID=169177 RepID=A0ABX2V6A8_9BACL|nr:hypothetical protein [Exiguobacterium undae]OAN10151.1 hypothetical protein A3783_15420 [Exiguobacterium undae]